MKVTDCVDTILNGNVFATRMLTRAKKFSGERMKFPIKYQKNVTGTSFSGFDTLPTGATSNRVNLEFPSSNYQITVALPFDELAANMDNEAKQVDLAAVELEGAAHDMVDDIGTLFYSTGTGNSSKDFLGLGAIVDDATDVGTYGTLARATYTTLNATRTASGGTLTLAAVSTLHSAITDGTIAPTLGLCPQAVWNFIEELIAPQERILKNNVPRTRGGLEVESGFTAIWYRGVPIVADRKATSGNLFLVNEDYLGFYARPTIPFAKAVPFKSQSIKGNDYSNVEGLGFHWSDWIKPSNSASVVGHIYLIGELLSENPKRMGRLTGITGV